MSDPTIRRPTTRQLKLLRAMRQQALRLGGPWDRTVQIPQVAYLLDQMPEATGAQIRRLAIWGWVEKPDSVWYPTGWRLTAAGNMLAKERTP